MMAAPDLEKMKLLVDRGAKVNTRAKTKYWSRWLRLNIGIQAPPSDGCSTAAPPCAFRRARARRSTMPARCSAAYAGNSDVLPALSRSGSRVDDAMLLKGTAPVTPLVGATLLGKTAVVRALLDAGAVLDRPEADTGITALDETVLGHQVDLARLLIQRGADVNHIDTLGMTPLLWAASVDFGDSPSSICCCIPATHAGARTEDGLTALDVARKYKHTHLLDAWAPGSNLHVLRLGAAHANLHRLLSQILMPGFQPDSPAASFAFTHTAPAPPLSENGFSPTISPGPATLNSIAPLANGRKLPKESVTASTTRVASRPSPRVRNRRA